MGQLQTVNIWTSRRTDLEMLGWLADDARFKLPALPLNQLGKAPAAWVRVVGEVRAQRPGESLTIGDESGQIVVATPQPEILPPGANVEIIGQPKAADNGWTLDQAIFRRTGSSAPRAEGIHRPGSPPLRLRLAQQVIDLPAEEAEKRYPVTLRGVVTWADERADFFYVQDSSGGVRIHRRVGSAGFQAAGSAVLVSGVTTMGAFLPEVTMADASYLGTMSVSPARRTTLEQALTGAEEGQRVEMRGYVRQVSAQSPWTRLDLTARTGEFSAFLPEDPALAALQGAIVRVRGVCAVVTNENRELMDVRLWVQGAEAVTVEEPRPADPAAVPEQTISALRQSPTTQLGEHRVRVAGQVLLHERRRYLYLQDDGGGLFVLTRQEGALRPGDRVEAVGIPGRAGNRLVLREATWRPLAAGPLPAPQVLENARVLRPADDGRLVRVAAVLREAFTEGGQARLTLETGDEVFDAVLHEIGGWKAPVAGSQLELTGVYVPEFDEYRRPHGFRLELRNAGDVRVLQAPPWWNAKRTGYAVGGLAAFTLLIIAWTVALRRRVRVQTEQIRQQIEREARMQTELERASRLESLGVLAGGIAHDFNNLLTAILGNLSLAAMDKRVTALAGDCLGEAERAARRARDITQQLLTFAKGGAPVRAAVALPEVVREAANFALHGSKVRLEMHCPAGLPPGDVDGGQISRVVHNLVVNSVQAMPNGGTVTIDLTEARVAAGEVPPLQAGRYIRMSVTDTGPGIAPEILPRIFDPYFSTKATRENSGLGLASVRSVVLKHNGHVDVESRLGHGSTFRLWLPAAATAVAAATDMPPPSAPRPARVLVMDDEQVIRSIAGRILALAGHRAVLTADGAEAIAAYTKAQEAGEPFDFVIFDLTVPGGMGGKDALQELRKIDADVRAIASSGYSSDPVMADPRAFGFHSSLPKPYGVAELERAIAEIRRA
jgi:signal transduction histidine kinase/CheY-like chemotaxis protein